MPLQYNSSPAEESDVADDDMEMVEEEDSIVVELLIFVEGDWLYSCVAPCEPRISWGSSWSRFHGFVDQPFREQSHQELHASAASWDPVVVTKREGVSGRVIGERQRKVIIKGRKSKRD